MEIARSSRRLVPRETWRAATCGVGVLPVIARPLFCAQAPCGIHAHRAPCGRQTREERRPDEKGAADDRRCCIRRADAEESVSVDTSTPARRTWRATSVVQRRGVMRI